MGDIVPKRLQQFAALPYRVVEGHPEVCLITSRETKRWILPKGQAEKKMAPHHVAENEAYEEAGLIGHIFASPFANFASVKRTKSGKEVPADVAVYLLEVVHELDNWPERKMRERRWMTPGEAALLTGEEALIRILLDFGARWD